MKSRPDDPAYPMSSLPGTPASGGGFPNPIAQSHGPTPRVLATFITTTSYGSWLPGDVRGYVHNGEILPHDPKLLQQSRARMSDVPVLFSPPQIIVLDFAIRSAAAEFGYVLTDFTIERWHLHWIIEHGFDPVKVMVGRLKNRMRQAIGRGRIWTSGYCHRCLYSLREIEICSAYIGRHKGCRMLDGKPTV